MPLTTSSRLLCPNMRVKQGIQKGFTLIEIAVALVIIGVILGSIMGPITQQRENQRVKDTEKLLQEIHDALIGFAAINGYLPCPATVASNGVEVRVGGAGSNCSNEHGFVPSVTLGLTGFFDDDNLITDPWGGAIRYSLNNANTWEYAIDIRLNAGPATFDICSVAGCGAGNVLAANVVVVLLSLGPDGDAGPAGLDQAENLDADDEFVSRIPTESGAAQFDDILTWISPNTLALHLVKSGRLGGG